MAYFLSRFMETILDFPMSLTKKDTTFLDLIVFLENNMLITDLHINVIQSIPRDPL